MCGIAGFRALRGATSLGPPELYRMADALAHRGPDGSGMWASSRGHVGLAHRRLSIIDLDHSADQPMASHDGRFQIVYNGEIYNHRALRQTLEATGAHFRTDHSDTEILLEGYRAWGLDRLLERIEGMYAFALYDSAEDVLVLVRDPIGIKPLYFTEHNGTLAFASEIKALLRLPCLTRRVDRQALYHYLSFMTVPAPGTMFESIAKLPAGHALRIGADGNPKAYRYWSPVRFIPEAQRPAPRRARWTDCVRTVRSLVEAAVEKHMVADVPVGVFLSGGVDSSTLLALMSRRAQQQVSSFTVGFRDDTAMNETNEAREIAKHFGSDHHEILIDGGDALRSLDAIVRHQDEPLADWVCLPLWHVAELAHRRGTKAILVGEGADELFLGYQSYRRFLDLATRARQLARMTPPLTASLVGMATRLLPPDRLGLRGLADHMRRGAGGQEMFWTGAIAYWESQKRAILRDDEHSHPPPRTTWSAYGLRPAAFAERESHAIVEAMLAPCHAERPHAEQHSRMLAAELALRLPELLLMRVDKMTMAHSLESRVPFLDRPLVEYVLGLDQATLIPQGRMKALLKEAVRGLIPDTVIDRPKRGFAAPVARWLRGDLGASLRPGIAAASWLDDAGLDRAKILHLFDRHMRGGKDLSLWLWPIVNLVIWHRLWIEEAPA